MNTMCRAKIDNKFYIGDIFKGGNINCMDNTCNEYETRSDKRAVGQSLIKPCADVSGISF